MPISLGELAAQFGCELIGDPDVEISNLASLSGATNGSLSFLSSAALKPQLASTRASAVILREADAADAPTAAIIHDDPYACYARMAAVICPPPVYEPGIHATAAVDPTAMVADSAHIAANAVVAENSRIGENVYVGPGVVVGPDCIVGRDSRLLANVTLARAVRMGARNIIHPGAVLGADGFGNAMTPEGWLKVPQLGGVQLGDDVEIGANTTVDCGALEDTVIGNGVRIDNLCMIAHNVHIGDHTAMAATVGIAGSARIGKRCLFAGRAGAVGHVTICDDVVVSALSFVSKDVTEPGTYAASFPAQPARAWARQLARFRRLGALADRVTRLEKSGK
ncbi:MAG: UDP-3-O-(3-hydroxymyristoyl)glucosamine N-acyltransferase [Gammaproteobacteria bacterium]|nr:UDP-3-O-(3-hydroxymyristoyl)glucosamine N-acyltransferase [Gammaproteobacteria bacterium]